MKAIVFGSNGYIGKHLASALFRQNYQVTLCDVQGSNSLAFGSYSKADVTDKNFFNTLDLEVDFIFFFAGLTGTYVAYDKYEEFIDVNEKGLLHLLNMMRRTKSGARLVFPSTRLVYKGVKDTPLHEEAEKEFKSIYALNKWTSEQLLKQYSSLFNISYTIVRICVPYGSSFADGYSFGTVGFFLSKAMAGEPISLYGDGSQRRTLTHVEDVCGQVLSTISYKESINETFNIFGETYSLHELASAIATRFNTKLMFKPWPELDLKMESGDTIFDGTKIKSLTNFCNQHSVEEWIKRI